MLHSFPPGVEEVLVHRGSVVALLDQLDLDVARVSQGDTHFHGGVGAAVAEIIRLHTVDIEPGADAVFDPVVHGGVDIAHDVADLGDLAEFPAHDSIYLHVSRLELIAAVAARRVARPPGSSAVEGTTATQSAPASR